MTLAAGAGLFGEAAEITGVLSGVLAMVSLGRLTVAQAEVGARAPRGHVAAAWVCWGVCILSVCAFAALSPV